MTSYGYARVSTRDQDPQLQINALEAAGCWPIVKEHASGVAKQRPVLDQVLGQLVRGDQFTVWKLDRLGRSITFLHRTIEDLTDRGVAFRSLTDPIDTTSPQGRLQLGILASFAAFERELIRERTLAGKARMRAEGRHTGGPALYGWEADHVTVNEAEAALIRLVTLHLLRGQPMGRIVDLMNTRPGWFPRPRRADRWRVTPLIRALENPTTAAIVGDDQHRKLVKILGRNRGQGQGKGGGRPARNLLSGILACSRCGSPMYATQQGGRNRSPQWVYRCRQAGGGRYIGCGRTIVVQHRADAYAAEMFMAAIVSEDFAQAMANRQAELLAGDTTAEELDDAREEIGDLEQVQDTRYYTDTMRERHAELRRLVEQATARLMAAPELAAMLDLPRSEAALRELWDGWTVAERRRWIRRLVSTIVVHPATGQGAASDVESRMAPVWIV
jgi:DNA invertase Pin-like site-specific DNA recombinase